MKKEHQAAVQLENVTRVYRQGQVEVHALRGLTLTVEKGEFTVIAVHWDMGYEDGSVGADVMLRSITSWRAVG